MATVMEKLKSFWVESKRVLMVTKKPGWREFKLAVKITGLGMILIGTIGLIIRLLGYVFTGS
ncbi:protein translocase SEC61 complex subunit gamma [Thermococcus sp.]